MSASVAIAALAAWLLIAEPLLGRRAHRQMVAAVNAGNAGERLRFHWRWTWQAWLLTAVTLTVTLGIADWTPAQLGLRSPDWPHVAANGFARGAARGLVTGLILAAAGGGVLGFILQRRRQAQPERAKPRAAANAAVLAMLPRTPAERWGFAALAVTAGITEEVVWRGFGLTLLFALMPGAHPAIPIVLAAAAFGWAHFYQGAAGMLVTGTIGGLLALLFWASGSLLLPMLLHVLLDLGALRVRLPEPTATASTGEVP